MFIDARKRRPAKAPFSFNTKKQELQTQSIFL